jgi:hypothetical protein
MSSIDVLLSSIDVLSIKIAHKILLILIPDASLVQGQCTDFLGRCTGMPSKGITRLL